MPQRAPDMPPVSVSERKKIAHLRKRDAALGEVLKRVKLAPLTRRENYFQALVGAIIGQQLSIKAADTIFSRFVALTPGKKFPTPRQVMHMPAAKMRKAGLSKMKVSFIKDLAKKNPERRGEPERDRLMERRGSGCASYPCEGDRALDGRNVFDIFAGARGCVFVRRSWAEERDARGLQTEEASDAEAGREACRTMETVSQPRFAVFMGEP